MFFWNLSSKAKQSCVTIKYGTFNIHFRESRRMVKFYIYWSVWFSTSRPNGWGLGERKEKKKPKQAGVSINLCANIFSFLLIQAIKKKWIIDHQNEPLERRKKNRHWNSNNYTIIISKGRYSALYTSHYRCWGGMLCHTTLTSWGSKRKKQLQRLPTYCATFLARGNGRADKTTWHEQIKCRKLEKTDPE